ncbi:DUF3122 domain-containing protein [Synechococcus sp. PCC 7336]|uniref:DUF3122 domain-containing protein n=1 Tax=Synechococcus sp. PCC 7336 TaxID=195250 RepID=UPI00035E12F1|nr:DUF3122 domain-containing protein [Synechococcus sp. PCC 7336]
MVCISTKFAPCLSFQRSLCGVCWAIAILLTVSVYWNGLASPAIARLDFVQEAPGQMLYKSFQSLKDDAGRPWQAIAFKRSFPDGSAWMLLRLVGFPGGVEVQRGKALRLTNYRGQTFVATDASERVFADNIVPANVGQFDIAAIVSQVDANAPLKLVLPTLDGDVAIAVPVGAIEEWQTVAYREAK